MTPLESQQFARAALLIVGDDSQNAAFRLGFAKGALVALAGLTEMPPTPRVFPPSLADVDPDLDRAFDEVELDMASRGVGSPAAFRDYEGRD